MNNKLELTWVDKNKRINIEPRILKYDLDNSFGDQLSDNLLIHGDNLLALKALEKDYSGKIKCVYIDPPYNTGSAFEYYDDNLEHSIWLNLMKKRIEILRKLLSDDGLIFVQIDDNEQAYLKVMMDEIFGRKNHLNTICVKMSEATGVKMTHANKRLPKLKEYILVYKKNEVKINEVKVPKDKWDSEYKLLMTNVTKNNIDSIKKIMANESTEAYELLKADELLKDVKVVNIEEYFKENNIKDKIEKDKFKYENAWRILRDVATTGGAKEIADIKRKNISGNFFLIQTKKNRKYLIKNSYNKDAEQPRIKMLFADDYLMINPCDLWLDISTTGLEAEGGVEFKNSKKPEKLVKRCIEIATNEGDFVLDSFLGCGTTVAVAHKMNRKWIGIEMGQHCYSHSKKRIDNVILGEQSGISKEMGWKKGGGYKFYELAPTLIKNDLFGEQIISSQYNAEMLAKAVALHEGFKYSPDANSFWKQSKGNEKSYLFVTTNFVSENLLNKISLELLESEYLIIACTSYDDKLENKYKNIILKKIPEMLLNKCEYGVENYNLNIIEDESEEQ